MQISSRFTIAVHVLTFIDYVAEREKVSSDFIAGSVGVNPVIVRSVMSQLREAGIVVTQRGSRGAQLARPIADVTFYDVYKAVESVKEEGLFHFHENPNPQCEIGRNIHAAMDDRLGDVQAAMEAQMRSITLADVADDLRRHIQLETV